MKIGPILYGELPFHLRKLPFLFSFIGVIDLQTMRPMKLPGQITMHGALDSAYEEKTDDSPSR